MDVTVCICTHNRPRYVRDCLDGLARQTVPPDGFAILVVDSGSAGQARDELARLAEATPRVRLLRLDQPGVSLARNTGARACATPYIAYIDDDAIPAPDWIERILAALNQADRPPTVLGGRILPIWEAPLPAWWPPTLRGVLSIIEAEGQGELGTPGLPAGLAPYTANMVLHVPSMLRAGGFSAGIGRHGTSLLSDEDVQLAWRLQESGHPVRYDSRIVVHHQIQAARLTPEWLLRRLYWQGISTVLTRRMMGRPGAVWREFPRRLVVAALCAPAGLLPRRSTRILWARWRLAYATGFVRAALGLPPQAAAPVGSHLRQARRFAYHARPEG